MLTSTCRRGALGFLLVLLVASSQARVATDDDNNDNTSDAPYLDGDEGESPDNDIPCQNALLQPQMKDKRIKLTPRQIQKDRSLNLLVTLRAKLETPRFCNFTSYEIITACKERPNPKADADGTKDKVEYEYGARVVYACPENEQYGFLVELQD